MNIKQPPKLTFFDIHKARRGALYFRVFGRNNPIPLVIHHAHQLSLTHPGKTFTEIAEGNNSFHDSGTSISLDKLHKLSNFPYGDMVSWFGITDLVVFRFNEPVSFCINNS